MADMKIKRVWMAGWAVVATSLVGSMIWNAMLYHRASKNAPPGMVVDIFTTRPLDIMTTVGVYGLIAMTLVSVASFVISRISK
jgi:hypothetical protein